MATSDADFSSDLTDAAVLDGDDMPRMRYEAASIGAIRGANVHSGSTHAGAA